MMDAKRRLQIKDIVMIGMLAAMCAIATTIKIPFGIGAMIHLGSALLFSVAIVFGGIYAGLAGAIGSAFYDLLMGFSAYTLWSFVIKGIAGFIAGWVAKGLWPENARAGHGLVRDLIGCIVAAAWTLVGYIAAWWQITGSLTVALSNVPSSLLTSAVGLIVALVLAPRLSRAMQR